MLFFLCFKTDNVSLVHSANGSWFIESLVKALQEWPPSQYDVIEILTMVNNEVSKKSERQFVDGVEVGMYYQLPEYRSTLRKKFYLQARP